VNAAKGVCRKVIGGVYGVEKGQKVAREDEEDGVDKKKSEGWRRCDF
jgi:hypothetical protein